MITNEQLAEIREYVAKATAGPWEAPQQRPIEEQSIYGAWKKEDADFITNARTDLPLLVAEVERLRQENDRCFTCEECGHRTTSCDPCEYGLMQSDLSAAQKRIEELEKIFADARYGVGCCSGGNASSGESANPRARENEPSKGSLRSPEAISAAKEPAMDSAHIPFIADIIDRHFSAPSQQGMEE